MTKPHLVIEVRTGWLLVKDNLGLFKGGELEYRLIGHSGAFDEDHEHNVELPPQGRIAKFDDGCEIEFRLTRLERVEVPLQ